MKKVLLLITAILAVAAGFPVSIHVYIPKYLRMAMYGIFMSTRNHILKGGPKRL